MKGILRRGDIKTMLALLPANEAFMLLVLEQTWEATVSMR